VNKELFLQALRQALGGLPDDEINRSVAFYEEMISDRTEDGMSEEQAVWSLGQPEEIARQIISETPPVKKAMGKIKRANTALVAVLLVLGFPVWFPVIVSLLAVVVSIYASLWAVILALAGTVLAVAVAAVVCAVWAVGSLLTGGAAGVAVIGAGLMALGFAAALGVLSWYLAIWLTPMTVVAVRWVISLFRRPKEAVK